MSQKKNALSITREENFSAWYKEVILKADLAELSDARGCMVIKPYGYSIWENIKTVLDNKFKELGHVNAYFPLFIPVDLFEKESEHVAGFAKEMAVVTHHRLECIDGKLIPSGKLETPYVVRPTSELIVGKSFSRWVKSYRDLPLLINQWCNVVRWEMRPRMFLRTAEILWQEGHTAHETAEEAIEETIRMHEVYKWMICSILQIFAIPGKKPEYDKFAGAVETYTLEAMMQDGKALQAATSHFLGQKFAKATDIKYQDRNGIMQYVYTSSWGLSTRIIGALIMSHADDDGLNLPAIIAPYQCVIIPIIKDNNGSDVIAYCNSIKNELLDKFRILIDTKDDSPQNKKWDYVRKGVPFILEIGIKEVENNSVFFTKRSNDLEKVKLSKDEFTHSFDKLLAEHDRILKNKHESICKSKLVDNIKTLDELKEYFSNNTGFAKVKWYGNKENLNKLEELSLSIRCIPTEQSGTIGKCILTEKETTQDVIIAKSY
ncbi:MAG: proline--tRNA ligase [Alphaproteobacteria bacterium]|nr:proline--tRNA ligase [Alphaproteobacteria bacterium]